MEDEPGHNGFAIASLLLAVAGPSWFPVAGPVTDLQVDGDRRRRRRLAVIVFAVVALALILLATDAIEGGTSTATTSA